MTTSQGIERLVIGPSVWPNKELQIQPGDLSHFAPYGNGVYGFDPKDANPILCAPEQEPSGGHIYFSNSVRRENFQSFLRMVGVTIGDKAYAAFVKRSINPGKDQYLTQMRLISKFGLRFMFNALSDKEYDSFKEQELTIEEALLGFIEVEKKKYGTSFFSRSLEGLFGGDGDSMREELNFGFALENEYYRIYRIWSRAWLVTK